ncbi:MAG: queuosine precursor transporter [Syntrophorhabdaceae bacterium]|nr:queuosine precursor transporter [Syntrophorhabdaceae bacterium]
MENKKTGTNSYSFFFAIVAVMFTTSLITANIIAVKLVNISGLVIPAAIIIFPVSYIFGDILTEVYGYRVARRVIWLGFLCNLITVVAVWLAQIMPYPAFWDGQGAYERILGYTPRLLIASFIAYLAGEFANSYVLAKMKILTKGRWLWTRTISSTFVGQGLDSLLFITIAFLGEIPSQGMINAIVTQWLTKTAYEVLFTPVTYLFVNFLKRYERKDVYDIDTRFNPFVVID